MHLVSYQFFQLPLFFFLSSLPESESLAALLFCPAQQLSHFLALLLAGGSYSLQLVPKALHFLCKHDKWQQSDTAQAEDSVDLKPFQFQARRVLSPAPSLLTNPVDRAGFGSTSPGRTITRNKAHTKYKQRLSLRINSLACVAEQTWPSRWLLVISSCDTCC